LQVVESLCLGVGDPDGFGDAAVDGFFESFPGFAERDVLELDECVLGVLPPCLLRVSTLVFSALQSVRAAYRIADFVR
jgi:hypothetical protein